MTSNESDKNPSRIYPADDNASKRFGTNSISYNVKSDEVRPLDLKSNVEEPPKKYPKVVFLIILNEFCERFSYYGLRTVLFLYLTKFVMMEQDTATAVYHAFTMLCYFSPLMGAILADGYIGLYRTILYVSIVYFLGEVVLTLTSIGPLGAPNTWGPAIGLIIIALGTGGIKPCVSAFGGNQFHPSQTRYLETFFSVFYLSINIGSTVSTLITPIFRSDVRCFGRECYPLAFGVPALFMLTAIVVFAIGTPYYNRQNDKKSGPNVILQTFGCIVLAVKNKFTSKEKKEHWLDYADTKYSGSLIHDVKSFCKVIVVFLPLPIFWALYDQQGSRWTAQAQQLNGRLGGFTIKPDQFQAVNPIFIVILVPLFDFVVYPLLAKINVLKNLLTRMALGLLFAIAAFAIAAVLESQMQAAFKDLNRPTQMRVMNFAPCSLNIETLDPKFDFKMALEEPVFNKNKYFNIPTDKSDKFFNADTQYVDFHVTGTCKNNIDIDQEITITNKDLPKNLVFHLDANKIQVSEFKYSTNQIIGESLLKVQEFKDLQQEFGAFKVQVKNKKDKVDFNVTVAGAEQKQFALVKSGNTPAVDKSYTSLDYDEYNVTVSINDQEEVKAVKMLLETCGCYTFLLFKNEVEDQARLDFIVLTDTYPNGISLLWQLIQIFVMTIGEILFSISGLAFAYSQAPVTMKSVLQSVWQMTVAFGNLIVVIIAEAKFVDNQVYEYIIFAGLLGVATIIFGILAFFYKYSDPKEHTKEKEEEKMQEALQAGVENPDYIGDDHTFFHKDIEHMVQLTGRSNEVVKF